jgi:hypothetical protein
VKQNSIRYRIREKIIARAYKKNKRRASFPNPANINLIGVICFENQQVDLVIDDVFKPSGIEKIVLKNGKRPRENDDMSIYNSDNNIWGLTKKKWLEDFINKRFSILIDLTDNTNNNVEYICALSNAEFLIGTNPKSKYFDLIIDQKFVNSSDLIVEIKDVLQKLSLKA